MKLQDIRSVARSVAVLVGDGEDNIEAIRLLAAELYDAGAFAEIHRDDDAIDDEHVTSEHTLVIDGIAVATWTRAAVGGYGIGGAGPDVWVSELDIAADGGVPDHVEAILRVFGLEDSEPSVPEPDRPSETYVASDTGVYAVCWDPGDNVAGVVARYDTLEAAEAVAEEYDRRLRQEHRGTLLGRYVVRELPVA